MSDTKSASVEKMKAQLDQWDAEIDKLTAKARGTKADAEVAYKDELQDLRERRDALKARLQEVQKSSESAWDEVQSGLSKAWDDMTDAMERARKNF